MINILHARLSTQRLRELAEEIVAALKADPGTAPVCACSEFGRCPACGGPRADERQAGGSNGSA
ncbi:hypothetical protein [Streptosporangium longisporum]|uniref:Uncharacterized protein n=1 Tax=Streptosporangium longisporum TaxID=46187 RepID=A0ABP6KZE1_9ACTN